MEKNRPDIYPPEFPDPLLPGGGLPKPDPEGVVKDAYLGELARDVEAEAPCGACGRYPVQPGGVSPGCGAVR